MKIVEGENAWTSDNGNIYLCKVLKATSTGKLRRFFIHFQGWKARYDCWTDEQSLAHEKDEAGKERLKKSIISAPPPPIKEKRKRVSLTTKDSTIDEEDTADCVASSAILSSSSVTNKASSLSVEDQLAAKKRRRVLAEQDLIDEYSGIDGEYVVRVPMPLNVKKHLVDEWSLVTGTGKRLISLPRAFTVTSIFEEFLDEKEKKSTPQIFAVYDDLFVGFKIFFDKALPFVLLYRQEREQFDALITILGESFVPSDVYGGEHLLRLFVRIQRSLAHVYIVAADMTSVVQKLTEFVKWIEKHKERFMIIGDYIPAEDSMSSLRSKTIEDFLPKDEKNNGNGNKIISAAKLRKKNSAEASKMKIKIEEPVLSSPSGRPMRAKAGKNKLFE